MISRNETRDRNGQGRFPAILSIATLLMLALSLQAISLQTHSAEQIGGVRQLYDGKLEPEILVNTSRNIDRLFPTRVVKRGNKSKELPYKTRQFEYFQYKDNGKDKDEIYDLYDYLAIGRVSGLLVLHDGEIAYERYMLGNSEQTRWMSMSVVKSMTAMLIGAAIQDGHIRGVNDRIVDYLPELKDSAYGDVTVRQLLQMTSGVAWNETYTDPTSDRRAMLDAQIQEQPGAILTLMAELPRSAEPGAVWNYSTGETHVAGALVRAATGMPVADYLSQTIWQPMGMESDANWWLESPEGLEVGGSGLSATLRDYGRFGLFMLQNGVVDGKQVLPQGWMRDATTPLQAGGETAPYGYMLWIMPDGAYAAVGIFGQWVYVNPESNVVIAMWSAQPKPVGRSGLNEEIFMTKLASAVHQYYSAQVDEE